MLGYINYITIVQYKIIINIFFIANYFLNRDTKIVYDLLKRVFELYILSY